MWEKKLRFILENCSLSDTAQLFGIWGFSDISKYIEGEEKKREGEEKKSTLGQISK